MRAGKWGIGALPQIVSLNDLGVDALPPAPLPPPPPVASDRISKPLPPPPPPPPVTTDCVPERPRRGRPHPRNHPPTSPLLYVPPPQIVSLNDLGVDALTPAATPYLYKPCS